MNKTEFEVLESDVKNNNLGNFYIFHGIEDYMKNFYLKKIEELLLDEAFKSFNLEKFDEQNFNLEDFSNSIESFPAMAEKKVIIVRDFDLYKIKADIRDEMIEILSDLPDYVCVIFDYATIEFKQDKRLKINNVIKDKARIVEFAFLSQNKMNTWLKRRFKAENIAISDKTCEYFTFICSMSMSNLSSECEKLCAYCTEEVLPSDIDAICSKVLEAKIFDITDKLLNRDVVSALQLIDDLILLKTDEFSIVSVINSQFQRLYSAKLGMKQHKNERYFMDLWSIRSSYAIRMSLQQAEKYETNFLRTACNLCVKTAMDMVSINMDKSQLLQLLIVKIGAINAEN
ncbi:MAG: DNA polymerase III subunit delta [Clostridia bacterium]